MAITQKALDFSSPNIRQKYLFILNACSFFSPVHHLGGELWITCVSEIIVTLNIPKYSYFYFILFFVSGSESPAPFLTDNRQMEGERIRQMAKRLIGPDVAEKQLSNEISAPYEVPQYPIEQIETKLIR